MDRHLASPSGNTPATDDQPAAAAAVVVAAADGLQAASSTPMMLLGAAGTGYIDSTIDRIKVETKQVIQQLYLSKLSKIMGEGEEEEKDEEEEEDEEEAVDDEGEDGGEEEEGGGGAVAGICLEKTQEVLKAWKLWRDRCATTAGIGAFLKKLDALLGNEEKEESIRGKGERAGKSSAVVAPPPPPTAATCITDDSDKPFPSFISSLDDGVSAIAFYRSQKNHGLKLHINERFASTFFSEKTYRVLLGETLPELIYTSLVADEDRAAFVQAICEHLFSSTTLKISKKEEHMTLPAFDPADERRFCGLSVVVKFIGRGNKSFIGVCRIRTVVEDQGDEICGVISIYPLPTSKYVAATEGNCDNTGGVATPQTSFLSGLTVCSQPTQHPSHSAASASRARIGKKGGGGELKDLRHCLNTQAYQFLDYGGIQDEQRWGRVEKGRGRASTSTTTTSASASVSQSASASFKPVGAQEGVADGSGKKEDSTSCCPSSLETGIGEPSLAKRTVAKVGGGGKKDSKGSPLESSPKKRKISKQEAPPSPTPPPPPPSSSGQKPDQEWIKSLVSHISNNMT